MRIIPLILGLALAFPFSAMAEDAAVRESFTRLDQCVQQGQDCTHFLTPGSAPVYSRFVGYGLSPCLPKDVAYVSQQPAGSYVIVRAATSAKGKPQIMSLRFAQEAGAWKLDIPATLQAGIGADWQQKLNAAEQVYVLLRQQLGAQMDCSTIQNLVK